MNKRGEEESWILKAKMKKTVSEHLFKFKTSCDRRRRQRVRKEKCNMKATKLNGFNRMEKLETMLLHAKICQILMYGNRQNYGKKKTFNLDRRRLRPIFP